MNLESHEPLFIVLLHEAPIVFAYGLSATGILGQIGFFDHFIVTFDWTPHPPCFDVQTISRV